MPKNLFRRAPKVSPRKQPSSRAKLARAGLVRALEPLEPRRHLAAQPLGIDATKYGILANTGADETAAIQALIDSLPRRSGIPDASGPIGGTIILPAGKIIIDGSLNIPSGVWLVGSKGGTTLYDISTDPNAPAIDLYCPYTNGFNDGASLQNLTIYAVAGPGVSTYGSTTAQVIDFSMSNVIISAAGAAIDLSAVKVYHNEFTNVLVTNNGGDALLLPNSTETSIDNFVVGGRARAGFVANGALIQVNGQNYFRGGSVSGTYPNAISLCVQGMATLTGFTVSASLGGANHIAVQVENAHSVFFDAISGISTTHQLQLINAEQVDVGQFNVSGKFNTLGDLVSIDSSSHLSVNRVNGARNAALPAVGNITYDLVTTAGTSSLDPNTFTAPTNVFNAADFGALADGSTDDTAAIQAAILAAQNAGGGVVYLGPGSFVISGPLKLPSGVWLCGDGDGTYIQDISTDPTTAAIQLVSLPGASSNNNCTIENLQINTTVAEGIMIDPALTGSVDHLQLLGLELSTGGTSIDLHALPVNNSDINRIVDNAPGGEVLWLGSPTAQGVGDYVLSLRTIENARSNFSLAGKALVEIYGSVTIQNGSIEAVNAMALPLYLSGRITVNGLYLEYPADCLPGGYEVEIQNAPQVSIDQLNMILTDRELDVVNSPDVRIGQIDIEGTLSTTMCVDSKSHVTIGTVFAPYDAGELNDPGFAIGGVYNDADARYLPNISPSTGNLLADPLFSTVGQTGSPWTIQWGDAGGAVTGTVTVIQTANGPTLQIVITSNPNNRPVSIIGSLLVPQSLQGHSAFVRMRIDATSGSQRTFDTDYGAAANTDVTGSLTSFMYSAPLAANGTLVMMLPNPTAGAVYDISGLGVYAC